MASAWGDLLGQGETAALQSARWLLEHLLQAEGVDRAMRSVSYQMKAARFPMHRDLAGFDFDASAVERKRPVSTALPRACRSGSESLGLNR